jgi:hypothetical protein
VLSEPEGNVPAGANLLTIGWRLLRVHISKEACCVLRDFFMSYKLPCDRRASPLRQCILWLKINQQILIYHLLHRRQGTVTIPWLHKINWRKYALLKECS